MMRIAAAFPRTVGRAWLIAIPLALFVALLLPATTRAASDIPPAPPQYFNDYAHVVDDATAQQLNQQLQDFERQTSTQIIAVIYPKLQTDDSLDDYCYRVASAWVVGQKKQSNGAVLFVFVQDHKMRIETGYGLEGVLPDVTCVRIQDDEMAPYFKRGDYAGGMRAGLQAMMAAAKGEYKGTGRTSQDQRAAQNDEAGEIFAILFVLLWLFLFFRQIRGTIYGSSGVGRYGGFFMGGGGFSGGGGGGFSGGGGGGGFSGGGGSFGGGGASGSW